MTGTGVFVRVIVGVSEMVGVKVKVDVGVSVSVAVFVGGMTVSVKVGSTDDVGVAGGEKDLKTEYNENASKMITTPMITAEYLAMGEGSCLSSLSVLEVGILGWGVPPIATSSLFTAVA